MIKQIKLKKKILLTSIAISAMTSSLNANAFWCGSPVCPGDHVIDVVAQAGREHLQNIRNNFLENMLLPAIEEQMLQQVELMGKSMIFDFQKNMMDTSNKTNTISDIANKKMLSDLQPIYDEACRLLTWQDYKKTKPKEVSTEILNKNASMTATRAIRGESERNHDIRNRQYSQMLEIQNNNEDKTIFDIDAYYSIDTLDGDTAKDALVAIDILTNSEMVIDRKIEADDSTAYYSEFVDNTRKGLVYNLIKYHLSDPITERLGVSNAQTTFEEMTENYDAPSEPVNNENNFLDKIVSDISNNEPEEDAEDNDTPPANGAMGVIESFPAAPLRYTRISSHFNPERIHPVHGIVRAHKGVDFTAPIGTPIYAPANATVIRAGIDSKGLNDGFGRLVFLNHGNGVQTWYGHLNETLVSNGESVEKGQLIAYSGNTGISSGPHLHYEIRIDNVPINPLGRYGVSNMEATNNLTREILGDHRFHNDLDTNWASQSADAKTLSSQAIRQELIAEGISFERAMEKFRELEKLKFILALQSLNEYNK